MRSASEGDLSDKMQLHSHSLIKTRYLKVAKQLTKFLHSFGFQIVQIVVQLLYIIPVFLSIALERVVDQEISRFIFGLPIILFLIPLIVANLVRIVALGCSVILAVDTSLQAA